MNETKSPLLRLQELIGLAAGQHYLLYVNAATGVQERILILLEDDNGTLAI